MIFRLLLLFWFFAIPSFSLSQDSMEVCAILEQVNSFEDVAKLKNESLTINTIKISDYSLIYNDSIFWPNEFQYLHGEDFGFNHVTTMKEGEIYAIKTDSINRFFKLVKLDSVLSFNVATLDFPAETIGTDSIFLGIINSLDNGLHWNELSYHLTDRYNPKINLKGSHGWIEGDMYVESFRSEISTVAFIVDCYQIG